MGNVTFGVPEDLALDLAKAINARMFIETGTYKGNTALWAGKNFHKVTTIEINKDRHNKTFARISNMIDTSNINMLQGNSKDVLKTVLDKTSEPIIFWLDAHGLGKPEEVTSLEDEIPLMQELAVILNWQQRTNQECVILIDDARLFLNPPPIEKGYHPEFWPDVDDIHVEFLSFHHEQNGMSFKGKIAKDIIVYAPDKYYDILENWSNK